MKVWCVQHRDGWCAVKDNTKPYEDDNNIPTECGHFVVLPFGIKKRKPTCSECKGKLK